MLLNDDIFLTKDSGQFSECISRPLDPRPAPFKLNLSELICWPAHWCFWADNFVHTFLTPTAKMSMSQEIPGPGNVKFVYGSSAFGDNVLRE